MKFKYKSLRRYTSIKDNSFGRDENGKYVFNLNLNEIAQTSNKIWISPATGAAHEFGHGAQYDKSLKDENVKYENNVPDQQYGNKEEHRNTMTTEQNAAKKHGEIKDGQWTRTDHTLGKTKKMDVGFKEMSKECRDLNNK